tara:strand:+ start:526 stop:792 length:267 start_codon:yes stop_codon:yes gene_type:complete
MTIQIFTEFIEYECHYRTGRIDAKGNEWVVIKDWRGVLEFAVGKYSHKTDTFRANLVFCESAFWPCAEFKTLEDKAIHCAEKRSLEFA